MSKQKTKRKQIDWEAIESAYRAGQASLRAIANAHDISDGAIRKRAKRDGWTRDLTKKVRDKVRDKLVRGGVRTNNAKDNEIVDQMSDVGVNVIREHRTDIAALKKIEAKLLKELGGNPTKLYITQYKGEIIQREVGIAVTERASALQSLASVQHKRIQLERQAFNLNDDATSENPLTSLLDELDGATKDMVTSRG